MERAIAGAKWRDARLFDVAAVVLAGVMNCWAKVDGGPMTAARLLGRPLLEPDDRWPDARGDEGPTAEETRLFDLAGIPGGQYTPEEVEQAWAELLLDEMPPGAR